MLHQTEWKVLLNKKQKKHTHTKKKHWQDPKRAEEIELCGAVWSWYSKRSLLELHCIDEVILSTRFSDKKMIELLFGPHIHDNGWEFHCIHY